VNAILFFLCVGVFFVFCVLIILFLNLWIICNGKALFLAMVQIVSHSCCILYSVIGVDSILFMWMMQAAILFPDGRLDVMFIVCIGFL
jgi:hypothetical protein